MGVGDRGEVPLGGSDSTVGVMEVDVGSRVRMGGSVAVTLESGTGGKGGVGRVGS